MRLQPFRARLEYMSKEAKEARASLRMTRFDTYTVLEGNHRHISTSFDHGEHDCIYLPILRDPRELPNIETHFDRELVKDWSGSSTMVFGQQQKAPNLQSGWASYLATRGGFPLREPRAMGRRAPKDYLPLIPKLTGLPQPRLYLYQRFRHLILNADPSLAEALMTDAWVYPLTASLSSQVVPWLIAERLDIERHANLSIDWRAMPSLESLFLDIRGFSQMVIDEDKVEDAAKMLEGKNLDLLVIAGLRSLEFYPSPEDMKVEEPRNGTGRFLITDTDEKDWIGLFRKAVRPGGKLILVDKQTNNIVPFRYW